MEKLGIQPILLLAQVVNFFIILLILKKFLLVPIRAFLEKRKKEIEEGIALTGKMREADEKLKASQEKALIKAREDALEIIEEAKKLAKEVERDIIKKANGQALVIVTRAREDAAETNKQAQAAIRAQAVDLAVMMAKRLLSGALSEKDQHTLITKRIADLKVWAQKNKQL